MALEIIDHEPHLRSNLNAQLFIATYGSTIFSDFSKICSNIPGISKTAPFFNPPAFARNRARFAGSIILPTAGTISLKLRNTTPTSFSNTHVAL